ncbi:CUB and sushi domain-containing protein 3 isoform X1 [Clarias gariepinus]|uniref:CUB and sushi domain-containing protein 3 isoform X1 n=1 Tax=Clarias gariepinus TaxID=13013 RepID=UPI00234DF00F|nr:CUB and sushi domain-containing protein 3 isoform X1 [Clarias gariepinus]XP_053354258.1 CUB and sushi domain-containing protein 3 isoform X1 [Clarias gariepinus]
MMRTKMVLWTWLLFLVAFVSRGEAGECLKPELKGNVVFTDSALLQNNFPNGSDVTLECAIGYEVANGSDTITCLNGKWSDQKLICKKKDCGLPSTTPNLKFDTHEGTLFGAYIKPICDRGYYLQGSSYRQCLATGWTGRSKCLLVTCGKIPEIPHSIIVSKPEKEILEFNDVIEYSCEDAFTLEGNRSVVCQQNRKYSSLPQCKNKCSEPKLEGNVVFTDSGLLQNDFPHGSKVTLECATGYEVANGSDTITCLNGEWSMQELICKMVPCGKLPEIPHSIIVSQPEKEILEFKDVIEYSCEDTYTLEGNRSVVCQENGKYSSFPQCKEIEGSGSLKYLQDHLNAGIGIITIIVIVIFGILLGRYIYQKRKGSYDTGEDKREKDAFIQQKSFNLIQSQYKVPPRPPP